MTLKQTSRTAAAERQVAELRNRSRTNPNRRNRRNRRKWSGFWARLLRRALTSACRTVSTCATDPGSWHVEVKVAGLVFPWTLRGPSPNNCTGWQRWTRKRQSQRLWQQWITTAPHFSPEAAQCRNPKVRRPSFFLQSEAMRGFRLWRTAASKTATTSTGPSEPGTSFARQRSGRTPQPEQSVAECPLTVGQELCCQTSAHLSQTRKS